MALNVELFFDGLDFYGLNVKNDGFVNNYRSYKIVEQPIFEFDSLWNRNCANKDLQDQFEMQTINA